MRRITVSSLLAGLLVLTMGLGAASATPTSNPFTLDFKIDCGDGEIYEGFLVDRGQTPYVGFIDSTERTIPVDLPEAWLVVDGEQEVFFAQSIGQGKRTGQQDRMLTCPGVIELPEEVYPALEEAFGVDLEGADEVLFVFEVTFWTTPAGPKE
jgi:hypothetical protein